MLVDILYCYVSREEEMYEFKRWVENAAQCTITNRVNQDISTTRVDIEFSVSQQRLRRGRDGWPTYQI